MHVIPFFVLFSTSRAFTQNIALNLELSAFEIFIKNLLYQSNFRTKNPKETNIGISILFTIYTFTNFCNYDYMLSFNIVLWEMRITSFCCEYENHIYFRNFICE